MIISKRDGQILKDFLSKQPHDLAYQASLSAEFVFENQNNQVKWELWYTSANDKARDFIRNFKESVEILDDAVDFQPRFVTWACPTCDSDFKRKECLSNGKYCAMNHKGSSVPGKEILMEDLREHCLWKSL